MHKIMRFLDEHPFSYGFIFVLSVAVITIFLFPPIMWLASLWYKVWL